MVSFRGQKKAWAMPRLVSFRGLIQNFRRAFPPPSICGVPPPGLDSVQIILVLRNSGLAMYATNQSNSVLV